MASDNQQKPSRTQADKERSRSQSRAISGKEAAKGVQGKPGQGQRNQPGTKQEPKGARPPGKPQSGKRPPAKGGSSRPRSRAPKQSRTALYAWGAVGLVILLVVVLVVVKITSGSSTSSTAPSPKAVTSTVAKQVTQIPESVFNTVGVTSPTIPVTAPKPTKGQKALTIDGKPGVMFLGGEFCPYCAAERWSVIAALSRFGKFSGLETMQSSATDVYPKTQTFTFVQAKYTSTYVGDWLVELYSNQKKPTGSGWKILQTPTKAQEANIAKYDTAQYTGGSATSSGSIPYLNFGNKFVSSGASYNPTNLQSLSRGQIAGALTSPTDAVTKAIISSANYMSAAVCSIDGSQPSNVCSGKGVQAAAKTMGIKV